MDIQIPTALLDGTVLAILNREEMYGYVLTKTVQGNLPISESTMYPVLRRLKKNGALETYDVPYEGRMRRYYRITQTGKDELTKIWSDWVVFRDVINRLMEVNEDE
ncbi:MAG: PadR family transcriptional regulator [Streptococcaceae bacterium]|nr:PadR family transcriptional regulator [Streptococcaceae bacterium]